MNRRSFLLGFGGLVAAPAILRMPLMMPVRGLILPATEEEVIVRVFTPGERYFFFRDKVVVTTTWDDFLWTYADGREKL
jgi:hypothetical protein